MKWQHIQYEDGSNPYICTTEKEFKLLKRKYGKRLQPIKEGFWIVRERWFMKICSKCGREFDLMKYGYPGNPYRRVCWECEPPTYAKSTGRKVISEDELDAMESRCLRDEEV